MTHSSFAVVTVQPGQAGNQRVGLSLYRTAREALHGWMQAMAPVVDHYLRRGRGTAAHKHLLFASDHLHKGLATTDLKTVRSHRAAAEAAWHEYWRATEEDMTGWGSTGSTEARPQVTLFEDVAWSGDAPATTGTVWLQADAAGSPWLDGPPVWPSIADFRAAFGTSPESITFRRCGVFALALHARTHWPLELIVDAAGNPVHIVARHPKTGALVDALGHHRIADLERILSASSTTPIEPARVLDDLAAGHLKGRELVPVVEAWLDRWLPFYTHPFRLDRLPADWSGGMPWIGMQDAREQGA